jgi:hypothetical protein
MDILSIDNKIHQYFDTENSKMGEYISKINHIQEIANDKEVDEHIRSRVLATLDEYKKKVDSIKSGETYGFYIAESCDVLERYKKLLKTPVKLTFFNNVQSQQSIVTDNKKEKDILVAAYIQIAKKYLPSVESEIELGSRAENTTECENCGSKRTITDNFSHICTDCGYERDTNATTLSYKDISRTNVLQKGTYEERSHFKDALNQYQGKQNCKIDRKIFNDLEQEFKSHHLLSKGENRFSRIKKEHVMLFLKELGYDKQYENANYIYSEMTGVKCPDISHLEDQLIADFDTLVNLYTKKFKYEKNIDRKSFINIQCVLFQLLLKNKHPCKKEDFNILKTTDRKTFHDDILRELFEELGWNYIPFF